MPRRGTTVIMIEGNDDAAVAARIYERLGTTLGRLRPPPTSARVLFGDENGPKGGIDTRCTITFRVPRRRDVAVTELASSAALAFDAAHDALDTGITREMERRRELVRRPKKYFAAKRLLESGDTRAPAPEVRPRRRRRAA